MRVMGWEDASDRGGEAGGRRPRGDVGRGGCVGVFHKPLGNGLKRSGGAKGGGRLSATSWRGK